MEIIGEYMSSEIANYYVRTPLTFFYMNDTFVLLGILGLTMFAGGIFSTVYCFGGWKSAPKWLVITAGVMNALCLLSLWSYCMK